MVPIYDEGCCTSFIHLNGVAAVLLSYAKSRGELGFGIWSCNGRPLGWIKPAPYPLRCIGAQLQLSGTLTPQWEQVPHGWRLIHPRYTLAVTQTLQGWLPTISDELTKQSHSLASRQTCAEARSILDDLLRRRVGREPPPFGLYKWFECYGKMTEHWQFQMALELAGPVIADLIRGCSTAPVRRANTPPGGATELAAFFDKVCRAGFDPAPRLATILATYIKAAALDIYRGGRSIAVTPRGFPVTFNVAELSAFRNRFRHAPVTDDEYLTFAHKHFIAPLAPLRRRHLHRWRGVREFRPTRADTPLCCTGKPGTRLFDFERVPPELLH